MELIGEKLFSPGENEFNLRCCSLEIEEFKWQVGMIN